MMNKYGRFEYLDYATGIEYWEHSFSSPESLQDISFMGYLIDGQKPYDYASFEQDSYVTNKPKKLYKYDQSFAFLTQKLSNEDGVFEEPVVLEVEFLSYISFTGITISSRNLIKNIVIQAYRDGVEIAKGTFSAIYKDNFYQIDAELVNFVRFTITEIDEPYHFCGIFDIKYGKKRIFDDSIVVNSQISNNFSVLGDTLEYDTLDLTVVDPEKENYLFQRKQPVDYVLNENKKNRFYIESGLELDNNTVQILAYDEIASLEDDFYGGIYENYSFNSLISDVFSGTNINFKTQNTDDIKLSGYLPISSRRKALQKILQGCNVRCYKGENLVFKPLETQSTNFIIDETKIIEKPQKTKTQEISSLIVKKHNYSKGTEFVEAYHWYISTTQNTTITFSEPLHSLEAYEVIGVDENGNDVLSEIQSTKITFKKKEANYCIVSSDTSNKVVIKGLKYIDSIVNYSKKNPYLSANGLYEDVNVDLTISSDPQEVCNLLYELHSRKNSVRFKTFLDVDVGGCYYILGEKLNIKSKLTSLNGIYEVEAV